MPLLKEFSYRAVDPHGGAVAKGTMEAATEGAVLSKLKAQGLLPIQVETVSRSGWNREVKIFGHNRRVSLKSLSLFTNQLSRMINAGLPLMRAIGIVVEQTEDAGLRSALTAVQTDLESGLSLSAAFAKYPHAFPPLLVSLVRVGEIGGFLGQSLDLLSTAYRADAELQDKLRSASTYPAVVLVIAIVAVIGMVTFIVPIFEGMFDSLGGELPLPTQILVTVSHNMVWILPLLAVLGFGAWWWWQKNKDTVEVRRFLDPYKLKMPIFGKLVTKVTVARFTRNLSMMLNAGVPLLQALDNVGSAANNHAIEEAVKDVQQSVRDGRSFAMPLAASEVFPPIVSQMALVGEESGTLPEMLGSVAELYEAEAKTATEQLASTLEPLLIVLIGVLIGGMVLTLYLPIFSLYSQLNSGG